jgi:hypothetical protein
MDDKMDDRDKNLIIKKSNLLHMDDYQNRNRTAPPKSGSTKKPKESGRKKAGNEPDERPNVGDEKRPA